MTRPIPAVVDGRLQGSPAAAGIVLDTPAWFAWLADPATRSFAFTGPVGRLTARQESRARGGSYWTAYRRVAGVLRKVYLGKATEVTLARLSAAAAALSALDVPPAAAPSPAPLAAPASRPHPAAGSVPLLATKLYAPPTHPGRVPRPHLIARLDAGRDGALTLVAAPAGFGKTTLLATWLAHLQQPVAWLSLDEADQDPHQVLRYLIAALQTVAPGCGQTALAALASPQLPSLPVLLTTLLNDLAALPRPCVLVLDDYHVLRPPALHEAITFLLEHRPPTLHLVIASREDPPLPLARLRARRQMTELRAADLRFSMDEVATFLTEVIGLSLSAEQVAALEARTEGWIAGLQMAALSLQDHTDIDGFLAAFTGSHHYVLDYLVDEVLSRQPDHVQSFLLRTSMLDRLCGPLCDAVLGAAEAGGIAPALAPASRDVLRQLERANLFLVPLDDARQWYRYHHLFGELLRARLTSDMPRDAVAALHRRAAQWYEHAGTWPEAVRHALAAADWEHAARLLEENRMFIVRGHLQPMLGWLNAFPDAYVRSRAPLGIVHAIALMFTNDLAAAEARLREAEACIRPDTPDDQARSIRGQVATIRGNIHRFAGDMAGCVAWSRQALDLLPATEARLQAVALGNVANAYLLSGEVGPAAERQVAAAVTATRASGNPYATLRCITLLARLHVVQGRLGQAALTYQEAARVAAAPDQLRLLVGSAAYYVGLGDLLRERNDLMAAEEHLREGLDLVPGTLTVDDEFCTAGHIALARVQQARGEGAAALATLDACADLARERAFMVILMARLAAARAQVWLAQDQLAAAVRWAETSGLRVDDDLAFPREAEYLTLARVAIAQGRQPRAGQTVAAARRLLGRLLAAAEAGGRTGSVIEILALQALASQAEDDLAGAVHVLARALALAQPEGYVRLFVDEGPPMASLLTRLRATAPRDGAAAASRTYLDTLLAAFPRAQAATLGAESPGRQAVPAEPLSAREREVLRLLGAGLPGPEIARTLFVSPSTIKSHLKSLYGKLDVHSRDQAIARARELRLLDGAERR
jgi:LuxR family maltose regulon positive regulatory protein